MQALQSKKVIIFGVGGVGSWCAEGLIRSGLVHLTIVDCDRVAESNVNRQSMATTKTIGQVKVDALKARLLEINPDAQITAIQDVYTQETNESFHLESYDYIVDCIDSIRDKCALLLNATNGTWGNKDGMLPQQTLPVAARVLFQFAFLLFHRNAGPVAYKLVGAGQRVEQRGFAAVRVARKGNFDLFLHTLTPSVKLL